MIARTLVVAGLSLAPMSWARAQDFDGGPVKWAESSWMLKRQFVRPTALTGANVVDVRTGAVQENVTLFVRGDAIDSIGEIEVPRGAERIDASGLWLIPGLFDLHAHVIPPTQFFPDMAPPEETLELLLDHGVTTIRALPFFSESAGVWSARVSAGLLSGPTVVPVSGIFEKERQRTTMAFHDAETARQWVAREALLGSRWIKIYNKMDEESLIAIVEEGAKHGIRVCGHAEGVRPLEAARIGQATIEHTIDIPMSCLRDDAGAPAFGDFYDKVTWGWQHFDERKGDELLDAFLDNGTGWVPTLVVTEAIMRVGHDGETPPEPEVAAEIDASLQQAAHLAVRFHRRGGLVGVGTDFPVDGVLPGDAVHRELELLVTKGGATPLEALQMGTLSSARLLGHESVLGSLEPGRIGHVVALRANPLDDISHTREIEFVLHAGRVHRASDDAADGDAGDGR